MADEDGIVATELSADQSKRVTGWIARNPPAEWNAIDPRDGDSTPAQLFLDWPSWSFGVFAEGAPVATPNDTDGVLHADIQDSWFEHMHVFPREISLGFIFSTQVIAMEIYNAFRRSSRTLSAVTNNAGDGIVFVGLPSLPAVMPAQSNLTHTIQVEPSGPPVINGTIDYTFDLLGPAGMIRPVPISGQRTVMFLFRPEEPLQERLQFRTDVLVRRSGTEQRIALRKNPRQFIQMRLLQKELENQRHFFEGIVFDFQASAFGIPVWWEGTTLTAPILVNDTVISVMSTDNRDFRPGDLAVVRVDHENFEALTIQSLTSTTITFETAFTNAFASGTEVYPIRIGFLDKTVRGNKHQVNLQETSFTFRITDNDANLADTSGFSSFNSKVLFDDPNLLLSRTLRESSERRFTVIDNETGVFLQLTNEDRSRRGSSKSWLAQDHATLWKVRQVLHALRGRQVSFYIPTFFKDMEPTGNVTFGGSTLDIRNIGYTTFVRSREPRNVIRVTKTDGTSEIRTITDSVELSDTEERLTVSPSWGISATVSEIERIDFIEKARFDKDEIVIDHTQGTGLSVISVPIKAVFD